MTQSYIAFDLEFRTDEALFEMHRQIDPKSSRKAVAIKTVTAAAALEFTIGTSGEIAIGTLASWTLADWPDEGALVEQALDFIRRRPKHKVLTFGGVSVDIPVVVLAAMRHGIVLPSQLQAKHTPWDRSHIDLGLLIKGAGKSWSHLSQVCLRLVIPPALIAAKASPIKPTSAEQWEQLRHHVELDTLLLALTWFAWCEAQGRDGIRYHTAAVAQIAAFLRRRPEHGLAEQLVRYQRHLEGEISAQYSNAA
ncbi:hypothetical protein [Erythrobacter sp. R86502]|uniref:hypothetical protein n=1 Tax=Erythrobacter sp. R86502 TaxID=3093846 RepID=UPI0036D38993